MSSHTSGFYEFGPFRLVPAERLLLREGQPVTLTPKAFEMLVVLVERSGRLVSKDELMKVLWPDTTVTEAILSNNVHAIRKALGGGQSYIKTVSKHGYRFVAEGRNPPAVVVERHTVTRAFTEEEVSEEVSAAEESAAEAAPFAAPLTLAAEARPGRAGRALPLARALVVAALSVAGAATPSASTGSPVRADPRRGRRRPCPSAGCPSRGSPPRARSRTPPSRPTAS